MKGHRFELRHIGLGEVPKEHVDHLRSYLGFEKDKGKEVDTDSYSNP